MSGKGGARMIVRLALRDLVHHRRESTGVVVMVALGLTLFIVGMSFVATVSANVDRLLFGTVGATWLVEPATGADELSVDEPAARAFREQAGATSVRARLEMPATLAPVDRPEDPSRPASTTVTLVGVDLADEPALAENFGVRAGLGTGAVLHEDVAHRLGVDVGDRLVLRVDGNATELDVTGLATPQHPSFVLSGWVLVDRPALGDVLYGDPGRANRLLVEAPGTEAGHHAVRTAAADLPGDVTVTSWTDTSWSALELGPRIWAIMLVTVLSFMFLVVCVGLTALVYAALLARLRDVALLRSTGLTPGQVSRMLMLEVLVQFLAGFVLAAAAATVTVAAIGAASPSSTAEAFTFAVGAATLELTLTWWALVVPFGIGLVLMLAVLVRPVRSISRRPVLELLASSA